MLDGKATYHGVRGHQLAIETLWHIQWQMFKTWLSEHGHEDEVNVTKPAQNVVNLFQAKCYYHTVEPLCYAVEQLPNILESEHVQGLLTEFTKTHSGNLGKSHGCQTFGDYADVLMNNVAIHLRCHTTRVM